MKLKARTLILAVVILLAVSCQVSVFAEDTGSGATQPAAGKLQNGSFETFGDSRFPQTSSSKYTQVIPKETDYWKTTAYEKKMELLRENTGVYIKGVKITPRDGEIAAELNADEESSLYQVVDTEPSSIYEWGISHAARVKSDTMAIIIGPNQDVAPSKNIGEGVVSGATVTGYKYGRDQMMQMVTWLKSSGAISDYDSAGIAGDGKPIVLYSKKFAENGGFEDNADNQPFSMTSSRTYTEKWHVWVITDDAITETVGSEKILKWYDYGSNAESGEQTGENLNKNYLYNVPSGQTKTLFAFTSVETKPEAENKVSNPTYGNFLDSVNFKIYRSLSGSTTPNGSAVIGSSDGSSSAEGAEAGHEITSGNGVKTYVQDGSELTIRAEIAAADKDEVSFAGVYCTIQKPDGSGAEKNFIPATDERWRITEKEGKIVYTRVLAKVESAVDLHFVFVRSPRITYDSNGGKPYNCQQTEKADEADSDNVYSFKPINQEDGQLKYIDPYTSHAAEGQSDAWKFTGWMLFDNSHYYEELLPAVHKVAYSQNAVNTANNTFTVIKGTDSFKEPVTGENGKTWTPKDGVTPLYSDKAPGLSFVAQWRWKQTFIPRTDNGSGFTESDEGGTVKVVNVNESDPNYEGNNAKGAKAYYAEKGETVTAQAAAKEGYTFTGWYDKNGNQVSLDDSISFVETKEGINTYYAHFVKQYTQRYIRQIEEGGVWKDLGDEDATKAELLDHTILHDGIGTTVSATAENNSRYSLIGWYDSEGNPVPDDMLINGGRTIRYAVKGNATYYARFAPSKQVLFKMQYVDIDGSISDPVAATQTYGKLSTYAEYGVEGDTVSSKVYPVIGYEFTGWYASPDGTEKITDILDVTDPKVITPEISNKDGVTYYARIRARTDVKYRVEHWFKNWNDATNGNYTRVKSFDYTDGVTGQSITPPLLDLTADGYEGYRYESGRDAQEIKGNGSTVFRIYYTRDVVPLKYDINMPKDESLSKDDATGSMADIEGYVGYTVRVGPQGGDTEFAVTGYTFNGWNTKADGSGTAYSNGDDYPLLPLETAEDGSKVNPNILYAQWVNTSTAAGYTVEHYKVSADGKTAALAKSESMMGTTGHSVDATAKEFSGYDYDANFNSGEMKTVASGIISEEENLVLKLYYRPQNDVLTYKPGGAAGADVKDEGVVSEEKTVKKGAALFTRPGYSFTGWKTPSGTSYSEESSYILTPGDDILIAQWKANTNTRYRVYHYLVSSDGLSASLAEKGEESLTETTGKTVWAKAKEIPGYKYNAGFDSNGMKTVSSGVVAADGSLVLSLYYIPNSSTEYTVEHYIVGADGEATIKETEKLKGTTGERVTASAIKIMGYDYDAEFDSNGMKTVASGIISGDGSLVLKLYYRPQNDVLTYKPGGAAGADVKDEGVVSEEKTVKKGAALFTRPGYSFTGWKTPSGTSYSEESSYTLTPGEDILIAQWQANTDTAYKVYHYLVSADGQRASTVEGVEVDRKGTTGTTVQAASMDIPGYTYNANFDANGMKTVASGIISGDGSLVLKLYYTLKKVPLVYHINDGTTETEGNGLETEKDILFGTSVTVKSEKTFSREGYTFEGWNTKADGTGKTYQPESKYNLTDEENHLYAQWQQKEATGDGEGEAGGGTTEEKPKDNLTYDPNGGSGEKGIRQFDEHSVIIVESNSYTREGYEFTGWNTKADGTGAMYQPGAKYTLTDEEDILYAQWKQKEATGDGEGEAGGGTTEEKPKDNLTYDPNGGSGEKGIRQFDEHSVIIVESNSYTREGYEFTGWNTKADGTGAMYQPGAEYTLTDEEDILYAQWKQKAPSGETDSDTGGEGGETGGDNGGSTGGETAPDTGNDGDKEPGSSVEKGSNTEKAESDEMAATGDSSHIMTGLALALLSLLGIAGVALKRRRKNS